MLSASRKLIVCLLLSVLYGFNLLVFFLLFPLALLTRAVVLFSFVPPCLFTICGLILLVVFSSANFLFRTTRFASVLSAVLIATLIVTSFWMISILRSICLSPLSSLGISILSSTGHLTAVALILVIRLAKVLFRLVAFSMLAA